MIYLTRELTRAAAWDAGNRSMRAGDRKEWSAVDFDAAVREYERLEHFAKIKHECECGATWFTEHAIPENCPTCGTPEYR